MCIYTWWGVYTYTHVHSAVILELGGFCHGHPRGSPGSQALSRDASQFLCIEDSSRQAEGGDPSGTTLNTICLLQSLLFYYFKLCTGGRICARQKRVQLPVLSQVSGR